MQSQLGSSLFAPLSTQTASQTKGGGSYYSYSCTPRVRVVYKVVRCCDPCKSYDPCVSSGYSSGGSINVTNPDIDDGAIVTFTSGRSVNLTNPDIDDGAIVNF
ncbi:MAG: hypothetical protein F6K30_18855 [Cyanothece sp. SIO2G6]|nr:hypothetical protein [Cyanothece sp. SIO2G6]